MRTRRVHTPHTSNRVYAADHYIMHLHHCSSVSARRVHFVLVVIPFFRMHIFTRASAQESSECSKVDWGKKKSRARRRELGGEGNCPRCPVHAVSTRSSLESAEGHGILACHRRCQQPGVAGASARPPAPSATPPDSRRPRRTRQRIGAAGSRSASPRRRRPTRAAAGAAAGATRVAARSRRGGPRVRRARVSPALPSVPRAAPVCVHCVPTPTLSRCPG